MIEKKCTNVNGIRVTAQGLHKKGVPEDKSAREPEWKMVKKAAWIKIWRASARFLSTNL
jgi:hypothetical protein